MEFNKALEIARSCAHGEIDRERALLVSRLIFKRIPIKQYDDFLVYAASVLTPDHLMQIASHLYVHLEVVSEVFKTVRVSLYPDRESVDKGALSIHMYDALDLLNQIPTYPMIRNLDTALKDIPNHRETEAFDAFFRENNWNPRRDLVGGHMLWTDWFFQAGGTREDLRELSARKIDAYKDGEAEAARLRLAFAIPVFEDAFQRRVVVGSGRLP